MSEKPSPDPSGLVQSNVRMPQRALDELDAWAAEENAKAGYKRVTRSDLIRDIVLERLAERRGTADGVARTVGEIVRARLVAPVSLPPPPPPAPSKRLKRGE